jgi:hypothetical protein
MKYIITENRLKKILDNELGGNLEWVEMITSEHQIPHEFDYHFSPNLRRKYLKDGPMYLLKIKGNLFLVQPKKITHWCVFQDTVGVTRILFGIFLVFPHSYP